MIEVHWIRPNPGPGPMSAQSCRSYCKIFSGSIIHGFLKHPTHVAPLPALAMACTPSSIFSLSNAMLLQQGLEPCQLWDAHLLCSIFPNFSMLYPGILLRLSAMSQQVLNNCSS